MSFKRLRLHQSTKKGWSCWKISLWKRAILERGHWCPVIFHYIVLADRLGLSRSHVSPILIVVLMKSREQLPSRKSWENLHHFTNTLIATHSNPFCAIVAIQIFPFNFFTEAQDQHAFQEFNHFVGIHGCYRCPWMRNKCDCTELDKYTFVEYNSDNGDDDDEKWRNCCFVVTRKKFWLEYITSNGRYG